MLWNTSESQILISIKEVEITNSWNKQQCLTVFTCELSMFDSVYMWAEYVWQCLHVSWVCLTVFTCELSMFDNVYMWAEYVCQCLHVSWVCLTVFTCKLSMVDNVYMWAEYVWQCLHVSWVCLTVFTCELSSFDSVYMWAEYVWQCLHVSWVYRFSCVSLEFFPIYWHNHSLRRNYIFFKESCQIPTQMLAGKYGLGI